MQEDRRAKNKQEIISYLLKLVTNDPVNMGQTTIDLLPTIERKNLPHVAFLGQGSYGSVTEAEWLGQKVAHKIFQGVDSRSFLLEANILAGLSHPANIWCLYWWPSGLDRDGAYAWRPAQGYSFSQ
jgi:hypothetical protein